MNRRLDFLRYHRASAFWSNHNIALIFDLATAKWLLQWKVGLTPVESRPHSSGKSEPLQRKVCIYNLIIVDHGNGYWTYYAHNSQLLVQAGDGVTQGQTISLAGSTGNSTDPRLLSVDYGPNQTEQDADFEQEQYTLAPRVGPMFTRLPSRSVTHLTPTDGDHFFEFWYG